MALNALVKGGSLKAGMGALGGIGTVAASAAALNGEKAGTGWIVPEGFVAVRTKFGQVERIRKKKGGRKGKPVPYIVEQGLHLAWPGAQSYKHVSVQDISSPLGAIPIDLEDGQHVYDANVRWRISRHGFNPNRALVKARNGELEPLVVSKCAEALGIVIKTMDFERVRARDSSILTPPDEKEAKDKLMNIDLEYIEQRIEDAGSEDIRASITPEPTQQELNIKRAIDNRVFLLCLETQLKYGVEILGIEVKSSAQHPIERLGGAIQAGQTPLGLGVMAVTHEFAVPDGIVGGNGFAIAGE